ncbi:BTB/POZ domain-containing protein 9-like protein [Dinothrombium tinctorium]|uniref:BTB/POZ domain-containing protein 9-like protein n=1 Tax=Dinothrombium tinctorium TaxID=1965070 RepID=A0A3S3PJB5_9ACAR|nr:BTB/POZ domain-containing protein 9-like protein [Dinothrombium tinctorium]RWS02363.1 BTB/POZ domain-containing protein 9-like protein [Dinothrombium tinctorium]RWS02497.1 BTB/POZ domain-containing protein 9-like protein [Dinothrombium tinctorium]
MSEINAKTSNLSKVGKVVSNFYLSEKFSDVYFMVEGEKFYAHRFILAASCKYFEKLLFWESNESKVKEIVLKCITKKLFKAVLQYIYNGFTETEDFTPIQLLSLMKLAHEYELVDLVQLSANKFKLDHFSYDNITKVFECAALLQNDSLLEKCWIFLECNSEEIVANLDLFSSFSFRMVSEIILRDTFYAKEIDIFKAIMAWNRVNQHPDFETILRNLRLNLISSEDFFTHIRPCNVFSDIQFLESTYSEKGIRKRTKCNVKCISSFRIPKDRSLLTQSNASHHILETTYELEEACEITCLYFNTKMALNCYVGLDQSELKQVYKWDDFDVKNYLNFERTRIKFIKFVGLEDMSNFRFY